MTAGLTNKLTGGTPQPGCGSGCKVQKGGQPDKSAIVAKLLMQLLQGGAKGADGTGLKAKGGGLIG